MDKIKGLFNDLTGGDGKVDSGDLQNAAKNADLGDLQAKADQFGLGGFDLEALGKLDFPLDKQEIISSLKTAGVNDQLISLLDKVPDQVYESLTQLQEKLPI